MIRYLLDVNILLSLLWEELEHHALVSHWFFELGQYSYATCALTQAGFVRISTNPRIIRRASTFPEARAAIAQFTEFSGHAYWPTDIGLREATAFCADKLLSSRQITDAYLLGLAIANDGVLVTLDAGFVQLAGKANARHVLYLNPGKIP